MAEGFFFDMFDWELGRSYFVSNYLVLVPHFGIKGGWIDQTIERAILLP